MGADHFDVISVKEFANTATGTLTNSGAGDVLCDASIQVSYNGTVYYIPLFDTKP